MQPKDAALRKRTQIAKANRMMFGWVAGASVVFGFALVGAIFLVQMLLFNERVLQEKRNTISTLRANIGNVAELESQVRVLDTNQALISSKANPSDQTLQVILDALPAEANSLALGASLQNRLLSGINGLTVNSLQVESTDTDSTSNEPATPNSPVVEAEYVINFSFSVTGNANALRQVLVNLERSIRTIQVLSLRIESQGNQQVLNVEARAFYEPARTVELKDKVVE